MYDVSVCFVDDVSAAAHRARLLGAGLLLLLLRIVRHPRRYEWYVHVTRLKLVRACAHISYTYEYGPNFGAPPASTPHTTTRRLDSRPLTQTRARPESRPTASVHKIGPLFSTGALKPQGKIGVNRDTVYQYTYVVPGTTLVQYHILHSLIGGSIYLCKAPRINCTNKQTLQV